MLTEAHEPTRNAGVVPHNVYFNMPSFIVFNDDDGLPLDEVTINDIDLVEVDQTSEIKWCKSCAWSSDIDWFFIIRDDDILLLNVSTDRGARCRRRSAGFIAFCLDNNWLTSRPRRSRPSRIGAEPSRHPGGTPR